jgi:hypothetical protein
LARRLLEIQTVGATWASGVGHIDRAIESGRAMSLMDANGHGSSRRQPFGATEGFTPFDLRTPRWDHAAEAE